MLQGFQQIFITWIVNGQDKVLFRVFPDKVINDEFNGPHFHAIHVGCSMQDTCPSVENEE